jgi:hypothetical protein
MQAVIITMVGRELSAERTAEQFRACGFHVEVFVQPEDWPVGPPSNNRNSRRALQWAVENVEGDGFLFVEDDVDINQPRLLRAWEAACITGEFMYFYMHDFAPRTSYYPDEDSWVDSLAGGNRSKKPKVDPKRLVVLEGPRLMKPSARMFGSQCLYFPKRYAEPVIKQMAGETLYSQRVRTIPQQPIDTSLNTFRSFHKLPVYCYLPHPAQHLQNRTLRVGERKGVYSVSYSLVSDLDLLAEPTEGGAE